MKNLKLAHKMLVLTIILMASMLVVAYVAVNRLAAVNAQIRQLVDRTIQKRNLASDLQNKLVLGIRARRIRSCRRTTSDRRSTRRNRGRS